MLFRSADVAAIRRLKPNSASFVVFEQNLTDPQAIQAAIERHVREFDVAPTLGDYDATGAAIATPPATSIPR